MRTTNDPKGDSIRVRLNDDMREYLVSKSWRSGKSMSDIVRDMIVRDMSMSPRGVHPTGE